MKQGQASQSKMGSTKTEPVSKAVDPGAVSRMGIEQSPFTTTKSMYEGRGLKAPMVGQTNHNAGSQGRH